MAQLAPLPQEGCAGLFDACRNVDDSSSDGKEEACSEPHTPVVADDEAALVSTPSKAKASFASQTRERRFVAPFFSRARARAPLERFFSCGASSLSLSSFDYFLSRVFEYSYAASRAVCPSWKREDSNVGRVCSKRSPYFRRSAPDDPEFLPYYKMLKVGAPPPAVAQKMATVTVCVWLTFFEEEGNAFQKSSRFGERFFFSFWRKTFLRALGQRRQGRVADRGDGAVRV